MPKTQVPDPSPQWTNIKTTYDTLTNKLLEKKVKDSHGKDTAVDVTDEQRQAAITYWIRRLGEDSASIAANQGPCTSS